MVRPIIIHPDPLLRKVSYPIEPWGVDEQAVLALKDLAQDMQDTVKMVGGAAIAAIQIGQPYRVIVLNTDVSTKVLVNPVILEHHGHFPTAPVLEGCLSVPGVMEKVWRYPWTQLRYQTLDGHTITEDFTSIASQAIQHEMEHLDGQLFLQHLSKTKRKQADRAMKKLHKEAAENRRTPFTEAYVKVWSANRSEQAAALTD